MKIKIIGKNITFVSDIKAEHLNKLEALRPEVLTLVNENKEVVFAMETGTIPSVTNFGITFDSVTDDGRAFVELHRDKIQKPEEVSEEFLTVLAKADALEEFIKTEAKTLEKDLEEWADKIEVIEI
mgnify:FL=1